MSITKFKNSIFFLNTQKMIDKRNNMAYKTTEFRVFYPLKGRKKQALRSPSVSEGSHTDVNLFI